MRPGETETFHWMLEEFAELKGDLPVPEPASFPLFASGLALMGWLAWRKNRKAAV